jgi:hypothetical protein
MHNENEEVDPEVSILPEDVVPVAPPAPVIVEPVVQPIVAPKPPAAPESTRTRPNMGRPSMVPVPTGSRPLFVSPIPQAAEVAPEQEAPEVDDVVPEPEAPAVEIVPGLTISAGLITEVNISSPRLEAVKLVKPQRMVLNVTKEPKEIFFQGLQVQTKYIDGVPAVIINHPSIAGNITMLVSGRPLARFVIEH